MDEQIIFGSFLESSAVMGNVDAINQVSAMWENRLSDKGFSDDLYNLDVPLEALQNMLHVAMELRSELEANRNVLLAMSKENHFCLKNYSIKLRNLSYIKDIKPKYLLDMVGSFKKYINDFYERPNNSTGIGVIVPMLTDSDRYRYYFESLVDTEYPAIRSSSDLLRYEESVSMVVSPRVVMQRLYPLFTDFVDIKSQNKVDGGIPSNSIKARSFKTLVDSIAAVKLQCDLEMGAIIKTVLADSNIGSKDKNQVLLVMRNMYISQLKNLIAYSLKYMSDQIHNVKEINKMINLYESVKSSQTLVNVNTANNSVIYESAYGVSYHDIDMSNVTPICDIADNAAKIFKARFDSIGNAINPDYTPKCDEDFYSEILSDISSLSKDISGIFEDFGKVPVSKLFDRCNFDDRVEDILDKIKENKFAEYAGEDLDWVYGEFVYTSRIMPKLSRAYETLKENLLQAITVVQDNVNNKFNIGIAREEMLSNFEKNLVKYEQFSKDSAEAFIRRINDAYRVPSGYLDMDSIRLDDNDYYTATQATRLVSINEAADDERLAINRYYDRKYMLKSCGFNLYLEEGEEEKKKDTTPTVTANETKGDVKNSNEEKKDTTPTVEVKENEPATKDGNKPDDKKNEKTGVKEKLMNVVNTIIEKVQNFLNSGKEKNQNFLENNKDKLFGLNCFGFTVPMIPHMDNDIMQQLKTIINNAFSIDDNKLSTMTEDQLRDTIFASMNLGSIAGDTLEDKLYQAFLTGSKDVDTVQKFTGNALAKKINTMWNTCNKYFSSIKVDMDAVSNTVNTKFDELSKKASSKKGERAGQNVKIIGSFVESALRAASKAMSKRNNDYLTAMNLLVSASDDKKEDK